MTLPSSGESITRLSVLQGTWTCVEHLYIGLPTTLSVYSSIIIPACWFYLPFILFFQLVWQIAGEPEPLATFNQHTDYVNCLAGGRSRAKVASAGLRAEVFLWDIQKGIRIHEQV